MISKFASLLEFFASWQMFFVSARREKAAGTDLDKNERWHDLDFNLEQATAEPV
jgi:hypothetical protein